MGIKVKTVPNSTNVSVQDANNLTVNVQSGNNVNVEVTPVPSQTIQVNRGVSGNGIESVSIYYDGTTYYLDIHYTNGTNELVPLPSTTAGVTSFNTRIGAVTLTFNDVVNALGYTPPTPTGTGASGTWNISVTGNAATVTNGVYTTGTYSDPLWITAIAASKITGTLTNSQLQNSNITINGTSVPLGGSINTPQGTITSVSGTAPVVSSGGTTPVISMHVADATHDGYLSSADWNTFNAKGTGTVTSVSASSPLASSGGATPNITIQAADATHSGYLSSTDWNIFNNKGNGTVTSVGGTGSVNGITLTGNITSSGNLTLGGTLSGIGNSQLTNSSITINGTPISLGGSVTTPQGTVTSVGATAGTGISVNGSPITSSGSFTITNTAPDQVVTLTGAGTTTVTGTYPNFTITSTGGSGMVYPSAGIPNSTGTAWGTSYSVSGSGTIVALQTNPTLYNPNIDVIDWDTTYATTLTAGQMGWDGNNTLAIGMAGGNVIQHIGEDLYFYCKATSAITKGQVVMFTGAVGASGVPTGAPATGVTDGTYIMGIAAESIALNGFGLIQVFGELRNVNTSGYADGDILWYNPSVTGGLTSTKPSAPNVKVQMATVINGGSSGGGTILIRINPGSTLGGTDSNAQINGASNGQFITYDGTNGYWKNTSISAGTAISVSSSSTGVLTITNTAPDQTVTLTGSGTTTITGTYPNFTITSNDQYTGTVTSVAMTVPTGLSITGSPITSSGTLALTYAAGYSIPTTASQTNWDSAYTQRLQWDGGSTNLVAATGRTSLGATTLGSNIFTITNPSAITFPRFNADNTVSALDAATFRTAIGAGTGNGTVTSVSALTIGTTGTDLSSTVATGTTTPVITLNVPTASATNRGALSSTDWSTFNGKQAAYTNLTSIGSLANGTGWLYNNGSGTFTYSTPTAAQVGAIPTSSAPSGSIVGTTDTQTLTNKRITPRVSTTTSSATPTINTDNVDMYGLTAQAVDITSFTTNLSGTPTDGQKLWIYIVGTAARAITWGASFESSTVSLPTTTVSTNRLDVGFVWNSATSKWRCVASA